MMIFFTLNGTRWKPERQTRFFFVCVCVSRTKLLLSIFLLLPFCLFLTFNKDKFLSLSGFFFLFSFYISMKLFNPPIGAGSTLHCMLNGARAELSLFHYLFLLASSSIHHVVKGKETQKGKDSFFSFSIFYDHLVRFPTIESLISFRIVY